MNTQSSLCNAMLFATDKFRNSSCKFKHPKRYVLVSGLPRNTMGKVQKNVLRDTYATEFQL